MDEVPPPAAGGSPPDDDSDALSDYSSCDGSEFDKYCSANSALGSASRCSSITNYAADLSDSPLRRSSRIENRTIRDEFWRSRWNYEPPESPRTNRDPLAASKLSSNGDSSAAAAAPQCVERVDLDEDSGRTDPDWTVLEEDEIDADGFSDDECSEDENWDEFVQESGGNGFGMLTLQLHDGVEYEQDERETPAASFLVRKEEAVRS